jgi:hypothetical protein
MQGLLLCKLKTSLFQSRRFGTMACVSAAAMLLTMGWWVDNQRDSA